MKRSELLDNIRRAADASVLNATDRDAILAKCSDPSVTRVAAGVFDYTSEGCMCPAALTFGMRVEGEPAFNAFGAAFDRLVGVQPAFGQVAVIEIED